MAFFDGIIDHVKKLGGGNSAVGASGLALAGPALLSAAPIFGPDVYNFYNSQRNFEFQRENYEYQKALQRKIFRREDSSVRRRVADLKAAGLSPVLAAGSGADAGAVISTHAPQRDGLQSDAANKIMSLVTMGNNIDMSLTQRKLMDSQIAMNNINTATKAHDLGIYKATNTTSNAGTIPNLVRNIVGAGDSPIIGPTVKELKDRIQSPSYWDNIYDLLKPKGQKNIDYNKSFDDLEKQRLNRR